MDGYNVYILTRNSPFKANVDYCITILNEVCYFFSHDSLSILLTTLRYTPGLWDCFAYFQAGLITKWTSDERRHMKSDMQNSETNMEGGEEEGIKALTMIHMQGPFLIFIIGTLGSFVVFIGEKYAGWKVIKICFSRSSTT